MEDNHDIYVIGLDMENRTPEEIAKDAALQIVDLFDKLVEKEQKKIYTYIVLLNNPIRII